MSEQELEVKLELKDQAQIEEIKAFVERYREGLWEDIIMKAVYYDTTEGFLQARKMAYRVRQENDIFVATYKSGKINEQGVFERVEINRVVESIEPDINVFESTAIWDTLKATQAATFVPVVITDFTRQCVLLSWQDTLMELAIDIGFVQGKEQREPLCEVEIELKAGSQEHLLALKTQLVKAFSLQPSLVSKYKKGLILAGL